MSRIQRIAPGLGRGGLIGNTEGPESYLRELDTLPSQFCRATGGTETVISQGGKFYRVHTFTDTDPTSLLLNFDGSNGSTTFTDDSGRGHAVTANGDAQISTTQSKFGGSSAAFDGAGDYLETTVSDSFNISGDMTLEFWVFFSSLSTAKRLVVIEHSGGKTVGVIISTGSTTSLELNHFGTGSLITTSSGLLSPSVWHHIAVVTESGTTKLYLDGTERGNVSSPFLNESCKVAIAGISGTYSGSELNGYIDSLRITKGQALYTAAFTPPTQALTRVGSGSLTFTRGGAVEYLVVGGGGGGGAYGGGGGAGGMIESSGTVSASSHFVGVGGGGAAGASGQNSVFTETAIGGGYGGEYLGNGGNGGSGGGGGVKDPSDTLGGTAESGQGNDGGGSVGAGASGGGGGAGAVGGGGSGTVSGSGGSGAESSISGSAVYYAGGGGGGCFSTGRTPGTGGSGGGGNGSATTTSTSGTSNTGGGGGGGGATVSTLYDGASGGSGIVIARYRITQAEYGGSPLLDIYSGAAAAYSLRSLSSSYTGPVVTVRRSSDDAEADFTASEVAGGALATWVGANDGFVTTWYDQSGNGNDATQATAGKQPKIVSSGALVTENGQPAVDFDGSDDFLVVPHSSELSIQASGNTVAMVAKGVNRFFQKGDGFGTQSDDYFFGNTNGLSVAGGFGNDAPSANSQTLFFARWNGTTIALFINGAKHSFASVQFATVSNGEINPTSNPTANTDDLYIGRRNNPGGSQLYLDGVIQDLVLWPSDISSQRTDIEAEISQAYGI